MNNSGAGVERAHRRDRITGGTNFHGAIRHGELA
jgi:hypothetical protein